MQVPLIHHLGARHQRLARTSLRGLIAGATVLAVVSLAACGSGVSSGGATATSDANVLHVSKAFVPKGELTIWDRSGDLYKVFDQVIVKFNKKYPNIKVHHEAVDIDAKLGNALIAGADVPDGTFVDDTKVPGFAPHLYNLTDVLAPYADKINTQKLGVTSTAGKRYGVPWDLDPGLLYYRADLLEKAGIDPASIKTYTDLLNAARQLKTANPSMRPIRLEQDAYLGQMWLEMFANQMGTNMTDKNGALRLDSEQYRTILSWLQTVVKEGLGTHVPYLKPADLAALDNGQIAFVPWAIWWDYAPQQLLKKTVGDWRAMELPAWTTGGARGGAMGGSSFAIPRDAKNPELAWLFYQFLVFDPEGFQAVYGPNSVYPKGLNTSIPSYTPALDAATPLFGPVDALGGQDLWKVAVKAGAAIPGGVPTPTWWPGAVDYLGNNLQRLLTGEMTPDEVISKSTEQIQTNLIDRQ